MKSIILLKIALLLCVFSESLSQDMDDRLCKKFRTGKYIYKQVEGSYSIRSKKKQVSYYRDGMINTFKVEWKTDCQFELTFISSSNPEQKTYKVNDKLLVSIIDIEDQCYTFESTLNGKNFPPTQMCKVKE